MSRPARGGWIEIVFFQNGLVVYSTSRPARGGWIEIYASGQPAVFYDVPPRTGRVD